MAIGDTVPIRCRRCKLLKQHTVVFEEEIHERGVVGLSTEEILEEMFARVDETYRVLRCLRCGTLAFQLLEDQYPSDPDADELELVATVYPDPHERGSHPSSYHFPLNVRRMYQETVATFNTSALVLTAVGIRATIEAVCKDKGCTDGSLLTKIDGLVASGYLARSQADYLHTIRMLGNDAAHEGETLSRSDVESALEILEKLLVVLYEMPANHDMLKLFRGLAKELKDLP